MIWRRFIDKFLHFKCKNELTTMNIKTIVNSKMIRLNKSENYLLVQIAWQADGAKSEKLIFGRICYSMKIHCPCICILFSCISHTSDCNGRRKNARNVEPSICMCMRTQKQQFHQNWCICTHLVKSRCIGHILGISLI